MRGRDRDRNQASEAAPHRHERCAARCALLRRSGRRAQPCDDAAPLHRERRRRLDSDRARVRTRPCARTSCSRSISKARAGRCPERARPRRGRLRTRLLAGPALLGPGLRHRSRRRVRRRKPARSARCKLGTSLITPPRAACCRRRALPTQARPRTCSPRPRPARGVQTHALRWRGRAGFGVRESALMR